MCGSTFHITSPLTLLILIKTKQNKTKHTTLTRVKEMMNYLLHQKLMIKPTVHISALSLGTVSLTETIILFIY